MDQITKGGRGNRIPQLEDHMINVDGEQKLKSADPMLTRASDIAIDLGSVADF